MESIVHALAARGHQVDVVLPHHPRFDYPDGDGVRFFRFRYSPTERVSPWGFGGSLNGTSHVRPQSALMAPAVVVALRRSISGRLAEDDYDVVHAHWLLPNAWVAAGPASRHGVPMVVTLHGTDVAMAERPLLRRLGTATLARAGAITAASENLRTRAVRLGADPEVTRTVPYGVDTKMFAPSERASSTDGLQVLAIGRLLEVKGFRFLIEAVARVDGVRLTIVGDGPLRSELEEAARRHAAKVTFAGDVQHRAIPGMLAGADVVAVPCVTGSAGNVDGLPNVLLEALSAGRPVIASAIGGIPDVVCDRANGLLTPEKDVAALASALTELRDRPELRAQLAAEARRRAVRELAWDAMAEAFEEAYLLAGASESADGRHAQHDLSRRVQRVRSARPRRRERAKAPI
jgi:glycosyltransferase involved in cell wall biosynthesis